MLLPKSKGQEKAKRGKTNKSKRANEGENYIWKEIQWKNILRSKLLLLSLFLTSKCKLSVTSHLKNLFINNIVYLCSIALYIPTSLPNTSKNSLTQHLNSILKENNFMCNFNMVIQVYYNTGYFIMDCFKKHNT